MEIMMLDFYVDNFKKGHKSNLGFQSISHWYVTQELHKHFPEFKHVLDADKVKSIKLSQGFKKVYNVFLACKDPSGYYQSVIWVYAQRAGQLRETVARAMMIRVQT